MSTRNIHDNLRLRASILLRLCGGAEGALALSWREFQHRYAPVISRFAREIGVAVSDADTVTQDVFRGFLGSEPLFVYDRTGGSFRRFLQNCTLHALRGRLSGCERELGWNWDELAGEEEVIRHLWDEAWEEQLVPRALTAMREESDDLVAFEGFWQHVVLGEEATDVATEMGTTVEHVHRSSERLTRALEDRLRQIRRQEG